MNGIRTENNLDFRLRVRTEESEFVECTLPLESEGKVQSCLLVGKNVIRKSLEEAF
jgi:hypothetical protein